MRVCRLHSLTEADAVCRGLPVEPEGHPRQDHQQHAGPVHLDEEVTHSALQVEAGHERGVCACPEDNSLVKYIY